VNPAKASTVLVGLGLLFAGGAWLVSCGPSPFPDESLINSVRIFATRSDHPYAKPGEAVTLTVLAADERSPSPSQEPMVLYWLPDPLTGKLFCENPLNDAYYGCFIPSDAGASDSGRSDAASPDAGANDAGSRGPSPCALPVPGVDLTPCLPPPGPSLSFTMPEDIITSHPRASGTAPPYGLAIVFNMACAGHPELLPVDPNNLSLNSLPIGCFDKNHHALDANSYVVGYASVYAYEALTNQNPVIQHVLFQGADLDGGVLGDSSTQEDAGAPEEGGVVIPHCPSSKSSDCPTVSFDVEVPASSWERDPLDLGSNGQPLGEQIWVDYYATTGSLSDDARLLYDPTIGKVITGGTAITFQAPTSPTTGTLWAVVHDNRGGVAWDVVPFVVR
jgi:hypothetical protein